MVRVRGGSGVDPHKTRVGSRVNPFLLRVKKIEFGSGIFRVGSGQKILTRFAMSTSWLGPNFPHAGFFAVSKTFLNTKSPGANGLNLTFESYPYLSLC